MTKKKLEEVQLIGEQEQMIDDTGELPFDLGDVDFCTEWDSVYAGLPKEKQRQYVEKEVNRTVKEGKQLLLTVLNEGVEQMPRELALEYIKSPRFRQATQKKTFPIRLLPGVKVNHRDPHGALLPADKRGKVLCAKLGHVSERDPNATAKSGAGKYSGSKTAATAKAAQLNYNSKAKLFVTVEIGTDPVELDSFDDVITVLRQYGFGVHPTRYMYSSDPNPDNHLDRWIVVEA